MGSGAEDREMVLRAWEALCGGPGVERVLEPVVRAYSEPRRPYHNLHHIAQCLRELNPVRPLCRDERAVEAALLFHDCVYDPARHDNEERSADVAAEVLGRVGPADPQSLALVRRLILATKHAATTTEGDEQIVVDIDLSILGKPVAEFDAYEKAIRQEYSFVPEDAFAAGRADFLRGLLARPFLYATPHFRQQYERAARANLLRSLEHLERPA